MKKWWAVYQLCLTQAFTHRAETLLWVVLDIFPSLIVIATWHVMFLAGNSIGGMSFQNLVSYYLAVQIILNLSETHFEERWITTIHQGKIDAFFIKPMTLSTYIFIDSLARKTVAFLSFTLPFGILSTIMVVNGSLHLEDLTPLRGIIFFLFIVAAFAFNYMFSFLIVLTTFWLDEEAGSVSHMKWILSSVFGGTLAPLALYPEWLQKIAALLPFQRLFSTPASILNHALSISYFWKELGILVVYIIVFYLGIRAFWKTAMKKYTSAGG